MRPSLPLLFGCVLALSQRASAQTFEVIAGDTPEQWYTTLGGPYVPFTSPQPDPSAIPKVNQDYVWGLTDAGNFIWFGTGGGTTAVAAAGAQIIVEGDTTPSEFRSRGGVKLRAWEFELSQYPSNIPEELKPFLGDWRPPKVFQYDPATKKLTNRTPNDPLLNQVIGLRSAGSDGNVVLLGGPSLVQIGVCMFAFDARTGLFLGSKFFPQYCNIRRWVNTSAGLYTSVQNTSNLVSRGAVLRWKGSRLAPFQFETVGLIDNAGAYITVHEDRLFVGTWAQESLLPILLRTTDQGQNLPELENPPPAGIWMSPKLGVLGLTNLNSLFWKKVWDVTKYEPDPVLAYDYSMGAMASYNGALYFGSLHYPNAGSAAFQQFYGYPPPRPPSGSGVPRNATNRPIIILRGTGFSNNQPTFELLYGDLQQPVFTPDPDPMVQGGTWAMVNNNYGVPGLYGNSGFGNRENAYTWSSAVHKGKLYFGTYDEGTFGDIGRVVDGIVAGMPLVNHGCGGDVWVFSSSTGPATALTTEGCGNPAAHGIRNMLSTPSGLYFGMANSHNLLGNFNDNLPNGGFELRRLVEP